MTWAPRVSLRRQWAALSPGKLAAPFAFATVLLFSAGAQAQQFDYSAVLAGQGRINGPVNAGGIVWQCNAKYCTTRGPWPVPGVKSCNALAAIVGQLASYGYKGHMLSANDMANCNGRQATATNQGPANMQTQPGQQPQPANQSSAAINPLAALLQNMANANGGNSGTANSNNGVNNSNAAGGSSGNSTPPSSTPSASTPAPSTGVSVPVSIRTADLTATGTGSLTLSSFAPTTVHTKSLRVTGTGSLAGAPFTPMTIHTRPLTVRGTGSL